MLKDSQDQFPELPIKVSEPPQFLVYQQTKIIDGEYYDVQVYENGPGVGFYVGMGRGEVSWMMNLGQSEFNNLFKDHPPSFFGEFTSSPESNTMKNVKYKWVVDRLMFIYNTSGVGGKTLALPENLMAEPAKEAITVKVALLGDAGVGKTSLAQRFVENTFDAASLEICDSLGVSLMEKVVKVLGTDITFSLWDVGGQTQEGAVREATAVVFLFDLTRISTLFSVKELYRQVRAIHGDSAHYFLVGTKYDYFAAYPEADQEELVQIARTFASCLKAPLVFCSASHSINVTALFKVILCRLYGLTCNIPQITQVGFPLIEYDIAESVVDAGKETAAR